MPSNPNRTLITTFAALLMTAAAARAQAVDPPSNVPIQAGPVLLAPVIRLNNVGHDSNVFNSSDNPQGDVTATLSPSIDGWLRMAHGRMNGRSQFDLYYFKTLTDLRAVDSDSSGHVEIPVNRVLVYATGGLTNTRHRENLEIDALARRRIDTVTVGADVRLTSKVTAGLFTRRSNLKYEANSLYLGTDLAQVLNFGSTAGGATVRYALTPLTTIGVGTELSRDRFVSASDRDSDNLRINSEITFAPRALISGRASMGVQKRKFRSGTAPDFTGTVASADLTYTLLGRTRFTVGGGRQLEYSYLVGQSDYVLSGVTLSVAQRFRDSWEVGGSAGRSRLTYRHDPSPTNAAANQNFPDETVLTFRGDLGYLLGHTRIGFYVDHRERQTDQPTLFRGYQRLRIGSALTYTF